MIELEYSLVIEATDEPDYFGFYSPDLEGFTGIGHSIEDCLYKAKWGMGEHINLLKDKRTACPSQKSKPENHYPEPARTGERLTLTAAKLPYYFY